MDKKSPLVVLVEYFEMLSPAEQIALARIAARVLGYTQEQVTFVL